MLQSIPTIIMTEDDVGTWCCVGCRYILDASTSEDEHVRRCKKAKRLIEQRRQLIARREARDED